MARAFQVVEADSDLIRLRRISTTTTTTTKEEKVKPRRGKKYEDGDEEYKPEEEDKEEKKRTSSKRRVVVEEEEDEDEGPVPECLLGMAPEAEVNEDDNGPMAKYAEKLYYSRNEDYDPIPLVFTFGPANTRRKPHVSRIIIRCRRSAAVASPATSPKEEKKAPAATTASTSSSSTIDSLLMLAAAACPRPPLVIGEPERSGPRRVAHGWKKPFLAKQRAETKKEEEEKVPTAAEMPKSSPSTASSCSSSSSSSADVHALAKALYDPYSNWNSPSVFL